MYDKLGCPKTFQTFSEAKKAPGQIQNGLLSSVWALLGSIWKPQASIWEGLGVQKCNPKRTQQWDYQKWCF